MKQQQQQQPTQRLHTSWQNWAIQSTAFASCKHNPSQVMFHNARRGGGGERREVCDCTHGPSSSQQTNEMGKGLNRILAKYWLFA